MVPLQHCTKKGPGSFVVQVSICLAMFVVSFCSVSLAVSPVPSDHLHQILHHSWSRYVVCSLFNDAVSSIGRGTKMNNDKLEVTCPRPNLITILEHVSSHWGKPRNTSQYGGYSSRVWKWILPDWKSAALRREILCPTFAVQIASFNSVIILDFKLSPCTECCTLSFAWFIGVWILYAEVSKQCLFHLHRWREQEE